MVEGLFAGGFETRVPFPGPTSFTTALTHELGIAARAGKVMSVIDLHDKVSSRIQQLPRITRFSGNELYQDESGKPQISEPANFTPHHRWLSAKRNRSLKLVPSESIEGKEIADPRDHTQSDACLKVLLAVHLEDDATHSDALKDWLLDAPREAVKFVAIEPSFSSILLLAVSIPVWDMLPDSPAVSFVAFTQDSELSFPEAKEASVALSASMLSPAPQARRTPLKVS